MEMGTPVLNYVSATSRPRILTLELTASAVRVTFPVLPKWACVSPIVLYAAVGLTKVAMGIGIGWITRGISAQFRAPPSPELLLLRRRFELEMLFGIGLLGLLWWSLAGYQWWQLRRWGRVPRVLTATSEGRVLSRLGWFRMRKRTWPAAEIASVELRPLKYNLPWTGKASLLYINRRKGWRLHYRLSSPDPLLPNEIARQLAHALGCPLL